MALRLVVDGRWLQQPVHGIARYTQALLEYLPMDAEDQVFVLYRRADFDPRQFQRKVPSAPHAMHWVEVKSPLFFWREAQEISALLKRLRPNVVHFPGFWQTVPMGDISWVMTLHDLIHLRPPVALKYAAYYRVLRSRLKQSAQVLTVSHQSARALTQWSPELKAKLTVTYLGLPEWQHDAETLAEDPDASPYFLYVGNPKPHKNTPLLFVAMEQLYQQLQRAGLRVAPRLITVGLPQTQAPWHVARSGITDLDLQRLYRGATAVLMPSLEEGCGLPLLEAMALQVPVLASDIAVFREILNGSGVCLDPREPSVWSRALAAFFVPEDPFLTVIQASQQRMSANRERFSWARLAADTYAVYCAAAEAGSHD